jgi:cyanophycin synthetase
MPSRPTFALSNFKFYRGPNPYLNTAAVVFDWEICPGARPLSLEDYLREIVRELPEIEVKSVNSLSQLWAQALGALSSLQMGLHLKQVSVTDVGESQRFALEALHEDTSRGIAYLLWDWLEAITQDEHFDWQQRQQALQKQFRLSAYGGPTSYALLRAAREKGIPTFYLPQERLMQYGYGKYQVRGRSTTFDRDSHLDSDFMTYKDDCKTFLANCGFPVPQGLTIYSLKAARQAAAELGYPVAVKPVVGHKGIGVTANVRSEQGLKFAYTKALEASPSARTGCIVEHYIPGSDFRLLCVGGQLAAAVERRPPAIIGDGYSTVARAIARENATPARQDSPTSPLAPIPVDEVLENYLSEQGLSLESIPEAGQVVPLRPVANISAGGTTQDVTRLVHPDNRQLAEEIARYFRLVVLGVDLIARDISQSWKEGACGVIEINAAPGVLMHLNPALGEGVDVPSQIIEVLFGSELTCRPPVVTFNRLARDDLYTLLERIGQLHPNWTVGGVCRQGMWLNGSDRPLQPDYNSNVRRFLRHPELDCLIVEYDEEIFLADGMAYEGSQLLVLDEPTQLEEKLARDLLSGGTLLLKQGEEVEIRSRDRWERHSLTEEGAFRALYFQEIMALV